MFQAWRWRIRQAEAACQAGRLEESMRIIQAGDLRSFQPSQQVVEQLQDAFLARARRHADEHDLVRAWRDWDAALSVSGETRSTNSTLEHIVGRELVVAEQQLVAGDPASAIAIVDALERRRADTERARSIREAARRIDAANHLQSKGRFGDAESQLKAARQIFPGVSFIEERLLKCAATASSCRTLTERLHEAISDSAWSRVVSVADKILELAPEHRLARDARQRAWDEVGTRLVATRQTAAPGRADRSERSRDAKPRSTSNASRFLLWIDAVGGYLVCLTDQIVLGQAAPGNSVDVPILGDISRRHAVIRRQGEGYFIEPIQPVRVDRQLIREPTLLSDGDQIELGNAVHLRFRKPHALSASARLDFLSRHSTLPSADGILLMAESCVLGPQWQNHVVCRNWSADVVLYRQEDELYCRAMDSIEIDGQWFEGRGRVGENSRISGTDFALSLEFV